MLNYPYLAANLRQLGVKVVSAGIEEDCDYIFSKEEYWLKNILSAIPFEPDIIIFMDSLNRALPKGLENSPCPLGLFCLDSTLNRFWQRPLAEICDLTLWDQQPEAVRSAGEGNNAQWFPLAADILIYHPLDLNREFDITFIGGRNPLTRSKRENILKALKSKFNLQIFDGDPLLSAVAAAEVYNRSRLVLNENLFPGVNLRLFEAMACGAAVLTEGDVPGLDVLFKDGRSIIAYNPDNLMDKVSHYLTHEDERAEIANAGSDEVLRKHSFERRAVEFITLISNPSVRNSPPAYKKKSALGKAFLGFALKWYDRAPDALETARRMLDESLKEQTTYEALVSLGKVYCIMGDAYKALSLFNEATLYSGEDFRASLYAGEVSAMLGNREAGNRHLSTAVELAGKQMKIESLPAYEGAGFHLFWGEVLAGKGDMLEAGLMKFHLPAPFWSALEHFRQAAQYDNRYWLEVGDLLMKCSAPDQALEAYKAAGGEVDAEKIKKAEKGAYLGLEEKLISTEEPIILSLCMIVKDEERNLEELLSAVGDIPDQIVVGDTGSSDNSYQVAQRFGAEVLRIPWANDFAVARNRTLDRARGRYIIYLDGDERLNPGEFRRFKERIPKAANQVFLVKLVNHQNGESCMQKRVFPNYPELRFRGAVHEQIVPDPRKFKSIAAPLTINHMEYLNGSSLKKKAWRNIKIIERELTEKPQDFYLHYHVAICQLNLDQPLKAIEHLRKVVYNGKAEGENREIFEHSIILLAKVFRRLSDRDMTAELLKELVRDVPESALGHYYLGVLCFEEQLYAECRRLLEKFFQLKLEPKRIPAAVERIIGWAHYYLGRCLEQDQCFNKAVGEYTQALEFADDSAKLLCDLGRASYRNNDLNGASKYLRSCIKNHPNNREAQKLLEKVAGEMVSE